MEVPFLLTKLVEVINCEVMVEAVSMAWLGVTVYSVLGVAVYSVLGVAVYLFVEVALCCTVAVVTTRLEEECVDVGLRIVNPLYSVGEGEIQDYYIPEIAIESQAVVVVVYVSISYLATGFSTFKLTSY